MTTYGWRVLGCHERPWLVVNLTTGEWYDRYPTRAIARAVADILNLGRKG